MSQAMGGEIGASDHNHKSFHLIVNSHSSWATNFKRSLFAIIAWGDDKGVFITISASEVEPAFAQIKEDEIGVIWVQGVFSDRDDAIFFLWGYFDRFFLFRV